MLQERRGPPHEAVDEAVNAVESGAETRTWAKSSQTSTWRTSEIALLAQASHLPEANLRPTPVTAVADDDAVMLALPEDVFERLAVQVVGSVACASGERPLAGP